MATPVRSTLKSAPLLLKSCSCISNAATLTAEMYIRNCILGHNFLLNKYSCKSMDRAKVSKSINCQKKKLDQYFAKYVLSKPAKEVGAGLLFFSVLQLLGAVGMGFPAHWSLLARKEKSVACQCLLLKLTIKVSYVHLFFFSGLFNGRIRLQRPNNIPCGIRTITKRYYLSMVFEIYIFIYIYII